MKLLRCQLPGAVTAGILGGAGAEAPQVPHSVIVGGAGARGLMLLGLTETLIQIHSHPHIMAIIQNDTLKRTHWLH